MVEHTSVAGIALAHACLNNRAVIKQCKILWQEPGARGFQFAIKWVPVDFWRKTDLDTMKQVVNTRLKTQITPTQTWGMVVKNGVTKNITQSISCVI